MKGRDEQLALLVEHVEPGLEVVKDVRDLRALGHERLGEPVDESSARTMSPRCLSTQCPACQTPVVRVEGGAVVKCPNDECPARLKRLLEHFVSRGAMNMDRIGERLAHTLVDKGLVHDVSDLFYITKDQLLELERMAEKSAQNVLDSIEGAKTRPWRASFLPGH